MSKMHRKHKNNNKRKQYRKSNNNNGSSKKINESKIIVKCNDIPIIEENNYDSITVLPNSFARSTMMTYVIKNDIKFCDLIYIDRWLRESRNVILVVYILEINIISFALLSANDYDPLNFHKNPYTLEFIYTKPEHRRKGSALKILNYIKKFFETTCMCDDEISKKLFIKSGYNKLNNNIYRFP